MSEARRGPRQKLRFRTLPISTLRKRPNTTRFEIVRTILTLPWPIGVWGKSQLHNIKSNNPGFYKISPTLSSSLCTHSKNPQAAKTFFDHLLLLLSLDASGKRSADLGGTDVAEDTGAELVAGVAKADLVVGVPLVDGASVAYK